MVKWVIRHNRWRIHQWLQAHPEFGIRPCKFTSKFICECHYIFTRKESGYPYMAASIKEAESWTDSTHMGMMADHQ